MSVDYAIWLAGTLTEVAVIGLLFYRRVWRSLPVFCAYCIWDVLSNLALYLIDKYLGAPYFEALFLATIIDFVLLFCVLVEVAWSVLRPLRASLPRSAFVLVGVLILIAAVAIWPF